MPALSNSKHDAVAQAYIKDPARIGWRAYQLVYPNSSETAARTAWTRLLKKADFSSRIAELNAKAADSAVMDLREVLAEQSKIGRADMRDFVHLGLCDDLAGAVCDLPPEKSAAVQELTVESYSEPGEELLEDQAHGGSLKRRTSRVVKRVKFRLYSKASALAELRAHHEPQKHEHSGRDGKPIETKDLTERPSDIEIARRLAFLLSQATTKTEKPDGA